jgi:predicted O-methyltransferase YrrM
MGTFLEKIRSRGVSQTARLALRRLNRYAALPLWYAYRFRHRNGGAIVTHDAGGATETLRQKEEFLRELLLRHESKRFLEIGIGEFPNVERIELMLDHDIRYTACDFASVCEGHSRALQERGITSPAIRFTGNRVGSYSWTLFDMLSRDERFDMVYLDGHHTFYVDLPAFMLAHQLLEPGGYFVVDDILWSLEFLKNTMFRSYGDWRFYRRIYDFAAYEPEQQAMPHMKMIVEQLLIKELGYVKIDKYCLPEWWVLQKPAGSTGVA